VRAEVPRQRLLAASNLAQARNIEVSIGRAVPYRSQFFQNDSPVEVQQRSKSSFLCVALSHGVRHQSI
jgi:hypothetical protein